jgi:hypothetical protein
MLWDRVQIRSGQLSGRVYSGLARALAESVEQLRALLWPLSDNDIVKRLNPLLDFG